MKKVVFCFCFLIDFLLFVLFLNYSFLLFVYLLFNIFFVIVFSKICFKMDVINFNKVKNVIYSYKIRKKLSVFEKYMERLNIRTFDGSGGTTHPCILKFQKPYNDYLYYMVHTPYDNHDVDLENPSLCVSNDGFNFINLDNVASPLLPICRNDSNKLLNYYNDNFLLYDNNELQVWYRYTKEDKRVSPVKLENEIYRIVTKDGVNFTKPELMIADDGIWYLSGSLVKINDLYYLYYFDKDFKMYCKTSKDLYNWCQPLFVKVGSYSGEMWHGEVKLINDKLYLLFLSKDYKLYWCVSKIDNPLEFMSCDLLKLNYYDKCNIYGNAHPYKSTFLVDDEYIYLYVPYVVNTVSLKKLKRHTKWTMTYTKLSLSNFNKFVKDDFYE